MSCIKAIKKRTCVRHFSDKIIDKKDIVKLLKAAVNAPKLVPVSPNMLAGGENR